MKNILVPVDLSDVSARVVDEACKIARAMKAAVHLLHVEGHHANLSETKHGDDDLHSYFSKRPGGARFALAQLKAMVIARGLAVEEMVSSGPPVWQIIRHAGLINADLIVIGTHGHGAFYRLIAGSIGERIRKNAPCPVVVVHSEEKQAVEPGAADKFAIAQSGREAKHDSWLRSLWH